MRVFLLVETCAVIVTWGNVNEQLYNNINLSATKATAMTTIPTKLKVLMPICTCISLKLIVYITKSQFWSYLMPHLR